MSNAIAAVLLGAVIGAVLTTLVRRHEVTLRPKALALALALALAMLAGAAVVVAVELVLAGSAQRLWEYAFISGGIVAAAVNLSTTRKRVEAH